MAIARQTSALTGDRRCLASYAGPCRRKTSARVTGENSTERDEQIEGRGVAGPLRGRQMQVARGRRQVTVAIAIHQCEQRRFVERQRANMTAMPQCCNQGDCRPVRVANDGERAASRCEDGSDQVDLVLQADLAAGSPFRALS